MLLIRKLILAFATFASSASFASFNGGAPETGAGNSSRVYSCILNDGSPRSGRPARLLVWLNSGAIQYAQLDVQFIDVQTHFDETMTVAIPGPLRRTTSGQVGVRKGRSPLLSRADLYEFSFPELRSHDFRTLPNQIQFRFSSTTGPVGQTGGSLMTGACKLTAMN